MPLSLAGKGGRCVPSIQSRPAWRSSLRSPRRAAGTSCLMLMATAVDMLYGFMLRPELYRLRSARAPRVAAARGSRYGESRARAHSLYVRACFSQTLEWSRRAGSTVVSD
eukprot:1335871-Prymnesium_polylepis.1